MRISIIILPAVILGMIGFFLGSYAKGTLEGAAVSALAGVLGGGIAGYAALGVMDRLRANRRQS
jgi:hypothetical protein